MDAKFGGLDKLREADWKQPEPEVKKVTKVRMKVIRITHHILMG